MCLINGTLSVDVTRKSFILNLGTVSLLLKPQIMARVGSSSATNRVHARTLTYRVNTDQHMKDIFELRVTD